ncbi:unnamed protein product [Heligmosomoides polygyrus]|uniref:Centromere/kinetochore protein zw10 middle domain-containing protein n=1 Tax=Heligmosomoides polygyrus TaxID=6339 RepID=A0A183F988_HELPZ|nr:unnamed protein product [Heligmosomoides polygyrus]
MVQVLVGVSKGAGSGVVKNVEQQCVAASISVPDSDGSKLKRAMELAEQFRVDMIDLKFFNDATPTFQAFAEQHFTVFIDRRCLEIIKKAKELICIPHLELLRLDRIIVVKSL